MATRQIRAASPSMDAESRRWRAEDDARTLARAEEIKADEARLRDVKAHAKRLTDAVTTTTRKARR